MNNSATRAPVIVTMYWNNISRKMVVDQKMTFRKLGYDIIQFERTGQSHGAFLDEQLRIIAEDDVILSVDIDCIPLHREVIDKAVSFARDGGIWGCAQVSNHLPEPEHVFAAPCFHAISKRTWRSLDCPSFCPDELNDVAQLMTRIAQTRGVPLHIAKPEFCLLPIYRFGSEYPYGVGTFFAGGVFHLYQSRTGRYHGLFSEVADCVIAGRPLDYLALAQAARRIEYQRLPFDTAIGLAQQMAQRIQRSFLGSRSKGTR